MNRPMRREDFGDTEEAIAGLMSAFNFLQQELLALLDQQAASKSTKMGLPFATDGSGTASLKVSHNLTARPQHVSVALMRAGGKALAATQAWSYDWVPANKEVQLSFVDLPASTDLVATVTVE